MSESNDKPKINLADAIRQKLEQKKQQSSAKPGSSFRRFSEAAKESK